MISLNPAPPASAFSLRAWAAMALGGAAYAAFIVAQWSEAYIDFGDGNYLYIARRIAEGGMVYRDILAPQPPCHLFLGAFLVKISQWCELESPLYLVRGFSLLLHLATALVVGDLARRAWGKGSIGALAVILFLFLPIGFWWSMGYQSEPLEIFFLVAMMSLALGHGRASDALTGVFGALAALTNATAAPFLLVLIIFMLARNPRRAAWIAIPALALAGLVTAVLELWTDGAFLRNVVLNQAATYPRGQFLSYALGKIAREGTDILVLDGPFVLIALLGFLRYLRTSPLDAQRREGLAWFCIATLFSFLYVTKGGTVDYIFCLGEPALAILAAWELKALWDVRGCSTSSVDEEPATRGGRVSPALLRAGAFALLAFTVLGPSTIHYTRLWNQSAFELPDLAHAGKKDDGTPGPNVDQVRRWIERYSRPGDAILAPPFYAFITGRRIWGDYSELFIWRMKDLNDRLENNPGGEGWSKTRALAAALERRELPIAIVELGQQGQLPEVAAALEKSYRSILANPPYYPTLNTRLGVYVPKP